MSEDKIIAIFLEIDDFCKEIDQFVLKNQLLGDTVKRRNRKTQMHLSEMMTIYIGFHLSAKTNFKSYYHDVVIKQWKHMFPIWFRYERFNQTQSRIFDSVNNAYTKSFQREMHRNIICRFYHTSSMSH